MSRKGCREVDLRGGKWAGCLKIRRCCWSSVRMGFMQFGGLWRLLEFMKPRLDGSASGWIATGLLSS